MGSVGNQINYDQFINQAWNGDLEWAGTGFSFASNVVVGTNPPYSITDFLAIYPNFGGNPLLLTGVVTAGSPVVTGLQSTAGILPGQPVSPVIPMPNPQTGQAQLIAGLFPNGATVLSVDSADQITVSTTAIATGTLLAIYNAPFVPMIVLMMYINLASASLVQARWQALWPMAMALYVAHWATLYLRSSGDVYSTPGQLASAGLARGIQISKSAGGVSVGIQPSTGGDLEAWGAWTETTFGVQLATLAKVIGSGPMWCY